MTLKTIKLAVALLVALAARDAFCEMADDADITDVTDAVAAANDDMELVLKPKSSDPVQLHEMENCREKLSGRDVQIQLTDSDFYLAVSVQDILFR